MRTRNKEIKFRMWDKEAEQMVLQEENGNEYVWMIGTEDIFIQHITECNIPEQVLMEYTGIKDKNNVEVFEGDIVNIIEIDDRGMVEYTTDIIWEDCQFVCKSGGEDYDTPLAAWSGNPNKTYPLFEIEVIGNIYDNVELLKN